MELTLKLDPLGQVTVLSDEVESHCFAIDDLIPGSNHSDCPHPLVDPQAYGTLLFAALFPSGKHTRQTLEKRPERILLVSADIAVQAIPWEFLYGPDGYIVCDCHFVRGIPATERQPVPSQPDVLHIVAVPSNPIAEDIEPLDIEGEWHNLREVVEKLEHHVILERTRPATLPALRERVAGQAGRVIHFMGHGSRRSDGQTGLCFEKPSGALEIVCAQDLIRRVRNTTYLVTLNACQSAQTGPTEFSNLAFALVQQGVPYALGMQFVIADTDAKIFSRAFYADLAHGSSVEEAIFQARLELADSPIPWAVGIPVLYTSLPTALSGSFTAQAGKPEIRDPRPQIDLLDLGSAEGVFQGRVMEQISLGEKLTQDPRAKLITLHGMGGQGKTRLARQVADRCAWAWPGGVTAISVENLPSRESFVLRLAQFLGIQDDGSTKPEALEQAVLLRLRQQRTLIVLDNAETLLDAVDQGKEEARRLAQFLKAQLPDTLASLLVTLRGHLEGFAGEALAELSGLTPHAGALLLQEWAPKKRAAIARAEAENLSEKVDGHPLSLRLLGIAFNEQTESLIEFSRKFTTRLREASDRYTSEKHRHQKLFATVETNIASVAEAHKYLLAGLTIFQSSFAPPAAQMIFDPEIEPSAIPDQLQFLWGRGLL